MHQWKFICSKLICIPGSCNSNSLCEKATSMNPLKQFLNRRYCTVQLMNTKTARRGKLGSAEWITNTIDHLAHHGYKYHSSGSAGPGLVFGSTTPTPLTTTLSLSMIDPPTVTYLTDLFWTCIFCELIDHWIPKVQNQRWKMLPIFCMYFFFLYLSRSAASSAWSHIWPFPTPFQYTFPLFLSPFHFSSVFLG